MKGKQWYEVTLFYGKLPKLDVADDWTNSVNNMDDLGKNNAIYGRYHEYIGRFFDRFLNTVLDVRRSIVHILLFE